jgi:hypothetical protein
MPEPERHLVAPEGWVPEFDGQRPPFQSGNTLAVTHGARSPRVIEPMAAELRDRALAAAPYLGDARWAGELEAWSRAEARVQVLLAYEDRVGGPLADDGTPRSHLGELHRAETRAQSARDRLGLNPAAAARLASYLASAERSVSLARLMAEDDEGERDGDR